MRLSIENNVEDNPTIVKKLYYLLFSTELRLSGNFVRRKIVFRVTRLIQDVEKKIKVQNIFEYYGDATLLLLFNAEYLEFVSHANRSVNNEFIY